MSLKAIILTALSKDEMTGYEITKGFTTAWGHFWQATHQQVYRELASLTDKNLVRFVTVGQPDKPDKKIYSLTEQGLLELNDWLATPCKEARVKDELSIKFFAGEIIDAQVLIRETKILQQRSLEKLAIFNQIEQTVFGDADLKKSFYAQCAHLSLRKGILIQQANITWCHEVLIAMNKV